mmetsp:Transcript_46213/g.108453  ORF Transcript_46213/g.108453 Transcript_46213/m.108453 type:complete len:327 (+) Transcript_46213:180-1160(+)
MGRGGGRGGAKHSKNNCAGSVFTNYERAKDKGSEGYGTVKTRLGGDSIKDWDCCSLSLQPCKDPVVTPEGILYEREAIYSYILKEKKRIADETKKWEAQQSAKPLEERAKRKAETDAQVKAFEDTECGILPAKKAKGDTMTKESVVFDTLKDSKVAGVRAHGSALGHKSLLEGERLAERAKDSCFWIADLTPEAKVQELVKPEQRVMCPISHKPLRLKDLVSVKFTPLDAGRDVTLNNVGANQRFVCPISSKTLSNAVAAAVLKPTGKCIALDVYETVIKKDMRDPFTGVPLKTSDVIILQRGGTGFAASGVNLQAEKYNACMRAF